MVDSLRREAAKVSSPRARLAVLLDTPTSIGDYASVARRIDSVLTSKPGLEIGGPLMVQRFRVRILRGQLAAAEQDVGTSLRTLAQQLDPAALFGAEAALAEAQVVLLGDSSAARARLARLETTIARSGAAGEDRVTLYRALVHARAGDAARARTLVAATRPLLARDSSIRNLIDGELALAERRPADAVRSFRRALGSEFLCMTCGAGALARAYDAMGQRDSVVAVYEFMLASRDPSDRLLEDQLERARALLRLGELYEARGDVTQALRRYREFVGLWKDADAPLQSVVADVRDRVARMERKRG